MLALDRPLQRGPFLAYGIVLVAAKVVLDAALARAFGRSFSLVFYIDPLSLLATAPPDGRGAHAWPDPAYGLTVVAASLPFLLAGFALMIRRLRDAGLPPALALLFFAPLLKFLAFAALAAVPPRVTPRTVRVGEGPFRSAEVEVGPPAPSPIRAARARRRLALLFGALAGVGVGLSAVALSVFALGNYGVPLMVAAPAVAGFVATWTYAHMHPVTLGAMAKVTLITVALGLLALSVSAVDGFACLVMAAPLLHGEAALGGLVAYALARSLPAPPRSVAASSLALLPLAFAANAASPPPPDDAAPVETAIVVRAPADVVWKRVVSFPTLPRPTEPIFRAGIAAPLAATIDGEGVGAVRRCEFTTGTFVEPIDVWAPGRELSFSVTSQPDPMREWTLYPGPRPPHLGRGLESTRGQFVLEPLDDRSTRLVGRTWYRVHMAPAAYWRVWSDWIVHAIHLRVLEHIAALAESDARGCYTPRALTEGGRP